MPRSCPAWELDSSSPSTPHPPGRRPGNGKLAALQVPGALEPCPRCTLPQPQNKVHCAAGTFQPTEGRPRPRSCAARLRAPGRAPRSPSAPPAPPAFLPSARADAIAPEEFALPFLNLPDPTLKRPRDAGGGADAEAGVGPGGLGAKLHSPRRPALAAPAPGRAGPWPGGPHGLTLLLHKKLMHAFVKKIGQVELGERSPCILPLGDNCY